VNAVERTACECDVVRRAVSECDEEGG
jgi:hypothetical protein